MKKHRNALAEGHQIHWYVIQKVLGQGGFGITYLAEDTNLGRQVAIKEYLPTDMSFREVDSSVQPVSGDAGDQYSWGLDRFISEAQTLARFKHANIVHVFSVFKENNTAYMVMEYEHGRGLDQILKQKHTLPEQEIKKIVLPLLEGLEQVHAIGFIHRDIKPANIYVREDGSPVLLDFGSARQSLGEYTRTMTAMVSPGFAPFEQYTSKGDKQGPWTDIYGLGATLFRAVTGLAPANAMDRSEAIHQTTRDSYVSATDINPSGYSPALLDAIDKALAFRPEDRPQSISVWRNYLLDDGPKTAATVAKVDSLSSAITQEELKPDSGTGNLQQATQQLPIDKPVSHRRWLGISVALVVFVLVMLVLANGPRRSREVPMTTEVSPATSEQLDSIEADYTDLLEVEDITGSDSNAIDNTAELTVPMASVIDAPRTDIPTPEPSTTSVSTSSDSPATISSSDRNSDISQNPDVRLLEQLRRRLEQNPEDQEARKALRGILTKYEQQIKQAMKDKNYARAEYVVQEMLKLAPNNQKLRDSLQRIRAQRQRR